MSYDIYLYKSKSGRPDLGEANACLDDSENRNSDSGLKDLKKQILKALLDFNPRLEVFKFDYAEIARHQKISVEEAKRQFNYIEINTPDEDLATQITIYDNNVALTIPFWYSGDKAQDLFKTVDQYLKIIHKASGYFVYDPQTESVYNPSDKSFDGLQTYESGSAYIDKLCTDTQTNPWWKFW